MYEGGDYNAPARSSSWLQIIVGGGGLVGEDGRWEERG